MTVEIFVVLGLTGVAMVLFATERLSVDLVALMVMAVLLISGLVTPRQGISGFGNMATVTVAAMFVLSAGLSKTGAVNVVGSALTVLGKHSAIVAVVTTMVFIAIISAFVNNTAAVAIPFPVVVEVARKLEISPAKLLIPLSFASMFGGTCTLIGTSTNILVSSIAEDHQEPAFGMFEFVPLGLLFSVVGMVYMATIGMRLIPQRRLERDLEESFGLGDYLTQLVILPGAASIGCTLAEAPLVRELELDVLEVAREGERILFPPSTLELQVNDAEIRELHAKIGELTVEKDFLAKAFGR